MVCKSNSKVDQLPLLKLKTYEFSYSNINPKIVTRKIWFLLPKINTKLVRVSRSTRPLSIGDAARGIRGRIGFTSDGSVGSGQGALENHAHRVNVSSQPFKRRKIKFSRHYLYLYGKSKRNDTF